jgi:hypothetical protein
MSKEHAEIKVTVKCANAICATHYTAFILAHKGANNKIKCPACHIYTPQKKLTITQFHSPLHFQSK